MPFSKILTDEMENCQKCGLCDQRTKVVIGQGNKNAKVLLVGEAPGKQEDLEGIPFVGRSGKLLDSIMGEFGFSRETNVYIANMVKCRPPENRDPTPKEVSCCIHYLHRQIEELNPQIVVCVGRIAAQQLISRDFKITKQHGEFFSINNRIYTATLHPAAILRNIKQKPLSQDDFGKIYALLNKNT